MTLNLKILHYNELDTSRVKDSFKKVSGFLQKGDFKSAEVKKMHQTGGLYRAKLDKENRLIFKYVRFGGERHILLMEIVHHHQYDKSKFLRGAEIDESKLTPAESTDHVPEADVQPLLFLNKRFATVYLLDKIISWDDEQHEIYTLPTPLVIVGSAGSGKTALTLEKMKHLRGNIAYVSLSPYLVENSQRIYYSNEYANEHQEVDFLSFKDYLESIRIPKGREMSFLYFDRWFARYKQVSKIRESYRLFEEFKGVLTGSIVDKPYLSRSEYLSLGVKQSIFLSAERESVYDVFEKYVEHLKEGLFYDSNIIAYEYLSLCKEQYDFIVVDEVQDFTNIQLTLILKSLNHPTNFLLCGDSNQIVHPNFFSWSKVKTLFFHQDLQGSLLRVLKTNYRNSRRVTKASNDLLKIKNARFGSIDKESTYLIETVSEMEGELNFYEDQEKTKRELNQRTQNSTKFAVLVMNNEEKGMAREFFKTPLVFSIQEAKGLEYENIILVNFITNYAKEFREIANGVTDEDLKDENMRYARAKDKENKDLEAYKFYINSLYVAFTRAVKNLYIIESDKKHDLLRLLGLVETKQQVAVAAQQSTEVDWLEEARRLEMQGKTEQAAEIRARIKGIAYLSPEQVEAMKELIFNSPAPDKTACQRLFDHAKNRYDVDLIQLLFEKAGFGPAKQYMGEYRNNQKIYLNACRNGNQKDVEKCVKNYGIDFRTTEGMTGLMVSVLYDKRLLTDYFLKQEADVRLADLQGRTVLQMVLLGFEQKTIKLPRLKELYPKFATPSIKCRVGDRIQKINRQSMEYFLVNFLLAIRDVIISADDPINMQGLNMDEFMDYIELMPEGILAEYRRKRQYVNSILSKNEVDREDRYNRMLFRRMSRGVYNLYEGMEIILKDHI